MRHMPNTTEVKMSHVRDLVYEDPGMVNVSLSVASRYMYGIEPTPTTLGVSPDAMSELRGWTESAPTSNVTVTVTPVTIIDNSASPLSTYPADGTEYESSWDITTSGLGVGEFIGLQIPISYYLNLHASPDSVDNIVVYRFNTYTKFNAGVKTLYSTGAVRFSNDLNSDATGGDGWSECAFYNTSDKIYIALDNMYNGDKIRVYISLSFPESSYAHRLQISWLDSTFNGYPAPESTALLTQELSVNTSLDFNCVVSGEPIATLNENNAVVKLNLLAAPQSETDRHV